MQLLLDTHVYLWCLYDDKKLDKKTRCLITDAEAVYVSAISIWEMGIKIQRGKYHANINELIDGVENSGFQHLSVAATHTKKLITLPPHHHDPFDRMLIAQAISEPLIFLTADKHLQNYSDLVTLA